MSKNLEAREADLSDLREAGDIAQAAEALAKDFSRQNPAYHQSKIEKYSLLALRSYLSSGRPSPALGLYVWLKAHYPLSETVARMASQLSHAIGRNQARRAHADEGMRVPTPFQELKARVSFEEFGTDEIERDQLQNEKLRAFPLLNYLRAVEVLKLLETAEYRSLEPGEVLFRETDQANAIYLLASGQIEMESSAQLRRQISEGEFFGDIAYFLVTPHSGMARAKVLSQVVCFPREELQACFERVPRLHQALIDWVYQKIFFACAPQSLIFRAVPPEKWGEAWDFFTPIHVPAGRVLMEPDRACDRFFLILKGRVEVRKEGTPSVRIGPGHFVGERGLLLQKQRSAKLVCLSDCHLLECDDWTYRELCEAFPEILKSVESRLSEIQDFKFSSKNFIVD